MIRFMPQILKILPPHREEKLRKSMGKRRKHIPMSTLNTLHLIMIPQMNSPRDKAAIDKSLLLKSANQGIEIKTNEEECVNRNINTANCL